jgi:hypothetical protein
MVGVDGNFFDSTRIGTPIFEFLPVYALLEWGADHDKYMIIQNKYQKNRRSKDFF